MGIEEKSLRVYDTKKTFFSRLGSTFSKIISPTKLGINTIVISLKRNTVIKNFKHFQKATEDKNALFEKTFENSFIVYLESIDELVIHSIYKKVTLGNASAFEREALSDYYNVIHTKENDEEEYKIKKQIYLLSLDYNLLREGNKDKAINDFNATYLFKMEQLYKSLLKHFSMRLTDNKLKGQEKDIYENIFTTLQEYVENIIPLQEGNEEIQADLSLYDTYAVGKLDKSDVIDKKLILLGISRKKFVHSLPLVVAEKCYEKLMNDTRELIVESTIDRKIEGAYQLFLREIDQYNDKLLSLKIYWDNPEQKREYTEFQSKRNQLEAIKEKRGLQEYERAKQILYIRNDFKKIDRNNYKELVKFYKRKLVELGDMKQIKNYVQIVTGRYHGAKLVIKGAA